MAYFFSLRGWLEVEPDKFDCVTEVIKSLKKKYSKDTKFGLYIQGWTWSESAVNWTRYLFYGADVTYEGLEFFQNILNNIIQAGSGLSGYFHAQGEDGDRNYTFIVTDDDLQFEEDDLKVAIS